MVDTGESQSYNPTMSKMRYRKLLPNISRRLRTV